jgi:hypothetical protein
MDWRATACYLACKEVVEMSKKRKATKEELELIEEASRALKLMREKRKRFEMAMNGNGDAMMGCMHEAGMIGKEKLEDYHKIKEKYGD